MARKWFFLAFLATNSAAPAMFPNKGNLNLQNETGVSAGFFFEWAHHHHHHHQQRGNLLEMNRDHLNPKAPTPKYLEQNISTSSISTPPPAPLPSIDDAFPPILPLPASWSNGSAKILLNSADFHIYATKSSSPELAAAFDRALRLMFPHESEAVAASASACRLSGVIVAVGDARAPLTVHTCACMHAHCTRTRPHTHERT